MEDLVLVAVAGFMAAMVDGALGMGFGPTSSAILLGVGISPTAATASINVAKVVTGLASGAAHWRAGNVDRRVMLHLALPGAAGAVVGAVILTSVDPSVLRPVLAVLLILIGLRILVRFGLQDPAALQGDHGEGPPDRVSGQPPAGTRVAGAVGGVTNGMIGAWGPVVTPFLLHHRVPPRLAVGSVNSAEVAVAVVSAGTLLGIAGNRSELDLGVIAAMLLGGVAAAPLAAHVIRRVPARALGLAVSGLLLLTQGRELANGVDTPLNRWFVYGAVLAGVALAALWPKIRRRWRADHLTDSTG